MNRNDKQNVLITGSAGFIGRNLTNIMEMEGGYNLFHVDEIQGESDEVFWKTLPIMRRYRANVGNIDVSDLEFWKIDYVIHLAARSHVDDSIKDPISFTMDNTVATHKLLEACRQYGKLKKFVMVSTDETIGSLELDDFPFREDDPIKPNSPYSASKAAQEVMARAYHETFDLPVVTTRCSNNYGPWQHESKLIPKVVKRLINGDAVPVYGNGKNIRDWIYVDDHCQGLIKAMELGKPGEIYHFGSNNEMTNLEIIKVIADTLYSQELEQSEYVDFVEDRLGHDARYAMNSQKAFKYLGYEPKYNDVKANIRNIINWARENESWLNR